MGENTSAEGALLLSKRSLRREALDGNVRVPAPEARYRRIAAPKDSETSMPGTAPSDRAQSDRTSAEGALAASSMPGIKNELKLVLDFFNKFLDI